MERGGGGGGGGGGDMMVVNVMFGGRRIPVSGVSETNTRVKDLKCILQPLTNVLPRGQKLIFKGQLLSDDDSTLKSANITNGSKIMLMATQGLHQGDGPITKAAAAAAAKVAVRPTTTTTNLHNPTLTATQKERWKLTGVISLSDSHLKVIPDEVWTCESSVRLLDLSKNHIFEVPANIRSLSSVKKLLLHKNDLMDERFDWEGVAYLKSLVVLSLSENYFTSVPPSIGSLTSLRELYVANNKVTSLPVEIGFLSQLQILKANNNRICAVPSCIGNCSSLIEIDLSSNLLVALPETFGDLQNLKALHLKNNGLKSLPSTLFKHCSKLSMLDLHGTDITVDLLRQFEGWEEFDDRRRSKLQKKLDFSVGWSGGFDEGADKD